MVIMIRNAGAPHFREALCEKGKPGARQGRKAYGPLFGEIAGLPNRVWALGRPLGERRKRDGRHDDSAPSRHYRV